MKKIALILSLLLLLATLIGCSKKSSKDTLYGWLLENGDLVNGTDLVYEDGNFTLYTDHSRKMYVEYIIPDHGGYEVTVRLPLFGKSEKVKAEITVRSGESFGDFWCYHYPESFTAKTPLSFETMYQNPDVETIDMSQYGTTIYEDGKMVFHMDESKRAAYEEKAQRNKGIAEQIKVREGIAKGISHEAISAILDWLKEEADMDASDLGYAQYKK